MEQVTIYHNPKCKKSQETLKFLREKRVEPKIIEYLKTPPKKEELRQIVNKLHKTPEDLVRKSEKEYKENFKGKQLTQEEWLEAMAKFPKLIERPIVVNGKKAVIGRPPENIKTLR